MRFHGSGERSPRREPRKWDFRDGNKSRRNNLAISPRGHGGHKEQKEFRRLHRLQIHTDSAFGCRHFLVLRHSCFVIPNIRVIRGRLLAPIVTM